MPRGRGKQKSGKANPSGAKLLLQTIPSKADVTIDLTNESIDLTNESIDLTNESIDNSCPEIIDLDDTVEEGDDEVEVIAFQLGVSVPVKKKSEESAPAPIKVLNSKPLEDKYFSSHKEDSNPFAFGNLKFEVENLAKMPTKTNHVDVLTETQTKASPNNDRSVEHKNTRLTKGQKSKFLSLGQKNNFISMGRKREVSSRQQRTVNRGSQRRNNNSDNTLKFTLTSLNKHGFKKNKTVKPIHQANNRYKSMRYYGSPNVFQQNNSNRVRVNQFVDSLPQRDFLGAPESSRENVQCNTDSDNDCKIIDSTTGAPQTVPVWTAYGLNAYVSSTGEKDDRQAGHPRPIFIDGSNVAMAHGKNNVFSCAGIKLCIEYFIARGHKKVKAFVPQYRRKSSESKDPQILEKLEREGLVVFTPSREVGGHRIASYDDRYIVQCAAVAGAIIVSNDNFRDLYDEEESWRETIKQRILPFTWIDQDWIMFPKDPLGRCGPPLDSFLLF